MNFFLIWNFFMKIIPHDWNDLLDGLNLRLRVNSSKYIAR